MFNDTLFKKAQGIASNPASGINNLPLNPAAAQQPNAMQQNTVVQPDQVIGDTPSQTQSQGAGSGVDSKHAVDVLKQISRVGNSQEMQNFKPEIQNIKGQLSTPELAKMFDKLDNAMDVNADPSKQTVNPTTGEREPLAQDIAKELAGRIEKYMRDQNQQEKQNVQSAQNAANIRTAAGKNTPPENQQKKKSRGNPFRVLMGQVGKLLDHGMKKRDIVKYISRKNYWNEDTISKAVDTVRDYNKKKRTKGKTNTKKASAFNLTRFAQYADTEQTDALNTVPFRSKDNEDEGFKADLDKRSTAELYARAAWLKSAKEFTGEKHSEGRKAADIKGVAGELRSIRAILKKRNFKEEELP